MFDGKHFAILVMFLWKGCMLLFFESLRDFFVERLHDFLCEQIDKLTIDEMLDRQRFAILAMLLWKVCFFWGVDMLSVFFWLRGCLILYVER